MPTSNWNGLGCHPMSADATPGKRGWSYSCPEARDVPTAIRPRWDAERPAQAPSGRLQRL
jgi:hypothetical protein